MADLRKRLAGNAPGEFYVDSSCIDCDLCRQIAPGVFHDAGDASIVQRQPFGASEMLRVTCPTASIGTLAKRDLKAALAAFPERIDGQVYFCGFASEASYGAS